MKLGESSQSSWQAGLLTTGPPGKSKNITNFKLENFIENLGAVLLTVDYMVVNLILARGQEAMSRCFKYLYKEGNL